MTQRRLTFCSLLLLLLLSSAIRLPAHNGPPFPILENRKIVGCCVVELWIHPDIGSSIVFVVVHPQPGRTVPGDLKMEIGVRPESGRLPEKLYGMSRENLPDYVQYNGQVDFDRDEMWKVRLVVSSGGVTEDAYSRVEATPVGLGRWDLLWFSAPFAGAGFLWFKMASRKRKLRRQALAQTQRASGA